MPAPLCYPLIPAFYFRPANLDAMAREFAYRVLAHIGLPQPDAYSLEGLTDLTNTGSGYPVVTSSVERGVGSG